MTDSDKRERRSHFRGASRPGKAVELTYRAGANGEPISTSTRNIGVGGAFIATEDPLAIDTPVTVQIHVPTADSPIEVQAEVRWVEDGSDPGSPAGMGVEFHALDVDQMVVLSDYFASLTGADTTL